MPQNRTAAATDGDIGAAIIETLRPEIRPRGDWAGDLPVTGEIIPEDDVRFLLVHHTASTNDYQPDEVVSQIRDFHRFHTGPEKGWPDVAYNFFVDRFGGIWEARAGSIEGAVRGDATGGSQGHALLCSLIGDHSTAEVTAEAKASMINLLAWLAERHGIDTTPGVSTEFVSRGSNRWPAGQTVTARTISGHRDMSKTTCPGDFAYRLVETDFPAEVTTAVAAARQMVLDRNAAAVTVIPAEPSTTPTTTSTTTSAAADSPTGGGEEAMANEVGASGDDLTSVAIGGAALGAVAAIGGLIRLRTRRQPNRRTG